jgi:hypothetical protein
MGGLRFDQMNGQRRLTTVDDRPAINVEDRDRRTLATAA